MNGERDSPSDLDDLASVAQYIHEIGHLKSVDRSGWVLAGIRHPESVAEHAFRSAVIGFCLAKLEGANAERTALLCLFHNSVGALAGSGEPTTAASEEDENKHSAGRASELGVVLDPEIGGIFEEYGIRESVESRLAHDADKIECLAQGLEYEYQGYPRARDWVERSFFSIDSKLGRLLAGALMESSPDAWWKDIGPDFRVPRP